MALFRVVLRGCTIPGMKKFPRSLFVGLVFLAGCGVGAATRIVTPTANAQQAEVLPAWEYMCFRERELGDFMQRANRAGADRWELAVMTDDRACFKRPK